MGEDDVSAFSGLAFAGTGSVELEGAFVNGPAGGEFFLSVTSPALGGGSVKQDYIAVFIRGEFFQVHLGGFHYGIGGSTALLLLIVVLAGYSTHDKEGCCSE